MRSRTVSEAGGAGRTRRIAQALSLALPFLLVLAPSLAPPLGAETRIPLTYFGDISCAHCDTILERTIPALEDFFGVTFAVDAYDILNPREEARATEMLARMDTSYRTPPVLFIGNNAYQGNYAIEKMLPREVIFFLDREEFRPFNPEAMETRHPGTIAAEQTGTSKSPGAPGVLRFFWGVGCPHCELAKPLLDRLEQRYPQIRIERYEVFQDQGHHQIFRETLNHYGLSSAGVPQFFFEDQAWLGFNETIARQIEEALQGGTPSRELTLPFFGTLTPEGTSLVAITAAIAFVDGFNPCSLWVLTLLLGLIAHSRSRRRILLVGGVFLLVTATIYGAFILGLLNIFTIAGASLPLRILVGTIAVGMGIINGKDFFAFHRGFSLAIPQAFRRPITAATRALAVTTASPAGLAGMTALFAGGIALAELPCTAGFPLIWSRTVTSAAGSQGLPGGFFALLLTLYILVYLLIEIGIVSTALVTLNRLRFGEGQARWIKLLGGTVMISLGGFYLADPEIANSLAGVATIFAVALALAGTLAMIGFLAPAIVRALRRLRPKQPDRADQ
ncbi:Cytochrome c biogenesis protein CcdA [Alkalispirochaeta americana]|uniref:Cytochrome c biogenesis protein CcdA n=1 Tax=Alkalispirochaeta americana TaxID=159291 RepID=A0A1N6R9Y9_9SPIO|nr:hypothetical protein [Alkalispirochaeta americana]SIQ25648.1 Cytochrome c biogenesis protein CcdA [Alkalispirochaeta americana]